MVELKVSSEAVDFDGNAYFSKCQGLKHIPVSCLPSKLVDASLLFSGIFELWYNYQPLPGHSAGSRQERAAWSLWTHKKIIFLPLIQSFLQSLAKSVE